MEKEIKKTVYRTVRDLLDYQAREQGSRTFLFDSDSKTEISFEQLQQQAIAVSRFIQSQGVEPGQSVAFAMHNGQTCAVTILGIMYGGYRAVAVNLVAGRDVIAYVLSHSKTTLILTQAEHVSLISEAMSCDAFDVADADPLVHVVDQYPNIPLADIGNLRQESHQTILGSRAGESRQAAGGQVESDQVESDQLESGQVENGELENGELESGESGSGESGSGHQAEGLNQAEEAHASAISENDDALLMYTSGTTGRPKGVVLSHSNVIAGGVNVALGHELSEQDRALCVLPLYHINGLCVTLFGPLLSAGSLVLPQRFSTSGFWHWIDEYQCTWFSVVPTQIAYLLRDAESSVPRPWLRFGRSASAPLSPDVHENFEAKFGVPLIETMGLTETSAQILSNPMPPGIRKLGSPGLPVGVEIRIADNALKDVPIGCEGELLIRGSSVMRRYFKNEQATAEALVQGDWLRTGDLAKIDNDGYLFVTGRLKELIIKGGENIAPREIDDALYQHVEVVEAAAFARPCANFGQRVEAAVSISSTSVLSESDLLQLCEQRVGKFKCPDRIHFLTELPKGPSGKIQRQKLLELLELAS